MRNLETPGIEVRQATRPWRKNRLPLWHFDVRVGDNECVFSERHPDVDSAYARACDVMARMDGGRT